MKYPAKFTFNKKSNWLSITFRDLPEAIAQGENEDDALSMAQDALITVLEYYFEKGSRVPVPSPPKHGERLVSVPASVSAKVLLLNEMLNQKIKRVELASKLGVTPPEVTRLTNLRYGTKIDRIEAALNALGKSLELSIT
ncbi:MAG: type II toxin-antitoxin system HicB family antitoxin [Burkholderiaceae bacterium]|jgi:antitoxin HicB|nr:type II toxin-antitoxin system HicB family antitoxin [Burkholderiaceae bacterium]